MYFQALVILSLIILLLSRSALYLCWKRVTGKLPLGPLPIPFVGNSLSIDPHQPHISFHKLTEKWGTLFTMLMGDQLVLVIADLDLIKKAFKNDAFTGRPTTIFHRIGLEKFGISSLLLGWLGSRLESCFRFRWVQNPFFRNRFLRRGPMDATEKILSERAEAIKCVALSILGKWVVYG